MGSSSYFEKDGMLRLAADHERLAEHADEGAASAKSPISPKTTTANE
jgi:hypothetical protein